MTKWCAMCHALALLRCLDVLSKKTLVESLRRGGTQTLDRIAVLPQRF